MASLKQSRLVPALRRGVRGFIDLDTHRFYPRIAGASGAVMTVEEQEQRLEEIRARLAELDEEHRNVRFSDAAKQEWNELKDEQKDVKETIRELKARTEQLREAAEETSALESGADFQVARPGAVRGDAIYDLTTVRSGSSDPDGMLGELRDRAMRSLESAKFPESRSVGLGDPGKRKQVKIDADETRAWIEHLMARHHNKNVHTEEPGELARRILVTGSPVYKRAFTKYLNSKGLSPDEQRALSIGTGSAGGFAVVYTLDPTLIPTSNLSVNPYRAIARVESITGTNEWRGVTTAGVTAAYAAEAAAATDNAPTLAQPSVVVAKAHCFVPASIEVTQDWGSIQSDLGPLFQDAKDDLEATQFSTGTYGAGTNPGGVITGATTTVTAGGTASFAVADIYKVWEALGARFRARARWIANLFTYDKVRQFDTAGGASIWIPNLQQGIQGDVPSPGKVGELLGKEGYESTAMAAAVTTGSKILAVGDFRYFIIVDRLGMDIEVIPHLFGAGQGNLPTGQRGFYAYWRNSAKVLDAAAFRVLVTG